MFVLTDWLPVWVRAWHTALVRCLGATRRVRSLRAAEFLPRMAGACMHGAASSLHPLHQLHPHPPRACTNCLIGRVGLLPPTVSVADRVLCETGGDAQRCCPSGTRGAPTATPTAPGAFVTAAPLSKPRRRRRRRRRHSCLELP
eukprot:COSAG01_NODE_3578_length_5914_cov_2.371625_3_plen_144_part_00